MRQYIGARYVPRFMGEYDNTQQYEALDVVDNGAGTTYIARIPVPANTPLTDTTHWIVYGASSGAILDLQNRMDTAENDIDNLQNDMSTAQGDITSLDGRLDVVEPIVSRLATRKVVMIGDSYGEQNDGTVTKWYWEYFKEALGLTEGTTFFHKFNSGAGFGNDGFLTAIQALSGSISDKTSITDVLVCGGWNDSDETQPYGTDAAFNSGTNNFINYVKTNYPNAQISLAHISWGNPTQYTNLHVQMRLSIKRYESLGSKGIRVLSGVEKILHRYESGIWQTGNYTHPSQLGQGYLGQYLPSAFLAGSVNIDYKSTGKSMVTGNAAKFKVVGSNAYADIYEELHDNVYTVSIRNLGLSIQAPDGQSYINAGTVVTNGSVTYGMCGTDFELGLSPSFGEDSAPIRIPSHVYDGANWYNAEMMVFIGTSSGNLFRIGLTVVKPDGTIPDNMSLTHIIVPPFTIQEPYSSC